MGNSQSDEFKPEDIQDSDLIFIAGGEDDSYHTLSTAWCYVVRTRKWLSIPPMLEPRKACAAATMQNSLYVAGGSTATRLGVGSFGGGETTSAAYDQQNALQASAARRISTSTGGGKPHVLAGVRRYNAELGRWEHDVPNMQRGREEFGLQTIADAFSGGTGCLYAVGDGCERYDPRTRRWESISDMDCKRQGCSTAVFDGRLYCAGGWTGDTVHRSVEVYEPRMDSWTFVANMKERRRNFGLATLQTSRTTNGGGMLIATGGQNEYMTFVKDPTATCELYDIRNNRWDYAECKLDAPKSYHATVAANGSVYNLGGSRQGWKVLLKSTVKDFEMLGNSGKWKQVAPALPVAVSSHAAASVCRRDESDAVVTPNVGTVRVEVEESHRTSFEDVPSAEVE